MCANMRIVRSPPAQQGPGGPGKGTPRRTHPGPTALPSGVLETTSHAPDRPGFQVLWWCFSCRTVPPFFERSGQGTLHRITPVLFYPRERGVVRPPSEVSIGVCGSTAARAWAGSWAGTWWGLHLHLQCV